MMRYYGKDDFFIEKSSFLLYDKNSVLRFAEVLYRIIRST